MSAHTDITTPTYSGMTDSSRQTAFTFAVIALSAKLTDQGQELTAAQYNVFREVFPMSAEEDGKIRSLLEMAARETMTPNHYVRQIMRLYPSKPSLYVQVFERLCVIAAAEGSVMLGSSLPYLEQVAKEFGIARRTMRRAIDNVQKQDDPYAMLQLPRRASEAQIKEKYVELSRKYHPDVAVSQGASGELVEQMTSKFAAINAAYDVICKEKFNKGANAF